MGTNTPRAEKGTGSKAEVGAGREAHSAQYLKWEISETNSQVGQIKLQEVIAVNPCKLILQKRPQGCAEFG